MTTWSAVAGGIGAEELLSWYEQMAVIRRTEKAAHDLFLAGLVKGTTHLAAGHEAVAVGASAALAPDDYVFATYRGHHHAMARGASPEECLAELMSRATGLCQAKGGSMHLTKASAGMLGAYAIVGAPLPLAAGAAGAVHLREQPLHGVHADRHGHRRRQSGRRPGACLRTACRGDRRERRGHCRRGRSPRRAASPVRARPDDPGGQDLPALRAQPHRRSEEH